jgi:indole-3-glycerol phosphate synthase
MAGTYLDKIVEHHRNRLLRDPRIFESREITPSGRPSFIDAIVQHRPYGLSVIAEVKKRSPSKGLLNGRIDVADWAQLYEKAGAIAISVLTDETFFGGSLDDLENASLSTSLPLLRKDFILCANDIGDAAERGASCVLLIAAVLSQREIANFIQLANSLGMASLVEVHSGDEARAAVDVGAVLIGVNQRDLRTFEVDTERAARIASFLAGSVVTVAESGIRDSMGAQRAAEAGFDAILVGEAIVTSPDPAETIKNLSSHPIGRSS